MSAVTRIYTAEDLAKMPTDEPWELWEGELQEVPGAGFEASDLAHWIGVLITNFARPLRLGKVTGADGNFILAYDPYTVVVPDVAFVRRERLPARGARKAYAPMPPDLAVEVVSPRDEPGKIEQKRALYRRAGVPLVWWVYPDLRLVTVFRDGQLVAEVGEDGVLDGEPVLPGFFLPVAEIFAEL